MSPPSPGVEKPTAAQAGLREQPGTDPSGGAIDEDSFDSPARGAEEDPSLKKKDERRSTASPSAIGALLGDLGIDVEVNSLVVGSVVKQRLVWVGGRGRRGKDLCTLFSSWEVSCGCCSRGEGKDLRTLF